MVNFTPKLFHIIDLSNLISATNFNLVKSNHINIVIRLSEDNNKNIYDLAKNIVKSFLCLFNNLILLCSLIKKNIFNDFIKINYSKLTYFNILSGEYFFFV